MCGCLWLAEKFLQKFRKFSNFVVAFRFCCKIFCSITTKQDKIRFLVLKGNIRHVRPGFALFTVVETGNFVGWKVNTPFVWTCCILHISDNNFLFRNNNPLTKPQGKRICLFFKRNIAHLTRGRALRRMIVVFTQKFKQCIRAHCIRTIHVPKKINIATVLATFRGEGATYCNCSQIFHTRLQRNNGSCRGGEFCDG